MRVQGTNAVWDSKVSMENAFDPEATHAMAVAFNAARWVLGFSSKSDHAAERVAHATVKIARTGERDPWRLRAQVLQNFGY